MGTAKRRSVSALSQQNGHSLPAKLVEGCSCLTNHDQNPSRDTWCMTCFVPALFQGLIIWEFASHCLWKKQRFVWCYTSWFTIFGIPCSKSCICMAFLVWSPTNHALGFSCTRLVFRFSAGGSSKPSHWRKIQCGLDNKKMTHRSWWFRAQPKLPCWDVEMRLLHRSLGQNELSRPEWDDFKLIINNFWVHWYLQIFPCFVGHI